MPTPAQSAPDEPEPTDVFNGAPGSDPAFDEVSVPDRVWSSDWRAYEDALRPPYLAFRECGP